jgi:hypothetical protein
MEVALPQQATHFVYFSAVMKILAISNLPQI